MKPIYIEMKAFGSYREEKITFDHINHGLFLITGDTGAGKTTIFDAISYALFEKTSGGNRNGAMMRSQYAADGIKTEVIFKFVYDGQVYRIRRWPKQPKFKKVKNEDRYERLKNDMGAGVELIMPDGTEFLGSKDDIDKKIETIIGLDASQFTQIAMLAQGDFMKLLLESSDKRKDIFAKIFDTRIYENIQFELERLYKQSYGMLEENRKDIVRELERIQCIENSDYENDWNVRKEKGLFTESEQEVLLNLVKNISKEAKEQQKSIKENRENCDKQLEEIHIKIQKAKSVNDLFIQLSKYSTEQDQLEEQADYIEKVKQKTKKGEQALFVQRVYEELQKKETALFKSEKRLKELNQWIEVNKVTMKKLEEQSKERKENYDHQSPKLISEIGKIRESLEKYDELNDVTVKNERLKESMNQLNVKIDGLLNNKNKLEEEQKKLMAETENLQADMENLEALNVESDLLERRKKSLDYILCYTEKLKMIMGELAEREAEYNRSQLIVEECQKEYERIYKEFINSQAEILRAELKDGRPCPVCGNVHYNLDEISAEHVNHNIDDTAMENVKNKLDEAKAVRDDLFKERQKKISEKESTVIILNSECNNTLDCDFEKGKEIIDEEYNKLVSNLNDLAQRKSIARNNERVIKGNEEKLKNLDRELMANADALTESNNQLNGFRLDEKEYEITMNALKNQLSYMDKETALRELDDRKLLLEKLEADYNESHEKYQSASKIMDTKNGEYITEKENRNARNEELTGAVSDYEESLKKNGFHNTDSFKLALLPKGEIEQLKLQVSKYDSRIAVVKDNLQRLEAETAGKQKADTETLEHTKNHLMEQKKTLDSQNERIYNVVSVNEECYKKVKKLYREREEMNKKNQMLTSLYKTANGQYSGKKINFQTYIQRRYFKQVIERANKRLYKMSNNQFVLQCRDMEDLGKTGYVGLDLDVYSIVNDQVRDVKTLSGGESFVAALSMALGMADMIQDNHGSVHIDTMFIDEGFGSLSDETRNQAIGILNELSEGKRLVGIISHVSELKAQVETKLVVSKTDSGSSTKWEY